MLIIMLDKVKITQNIEELCGNAILSLFILH